MRTAAGCGDAARDIDANAALKAAEAAGYTTDDVLAIQTGADGALTVYIDDRA